MVKEPVKSNLDVDYVISYRIDTKSKSFDAELMT